VRLWYVPLQALDDRRVIAQHHEIHMLFGMARYRNWDLLWDGVHYAGHLWCVVDYHQLSVDEMVRRGYNGHQSPVDQDVLDHLAIWTPPCSGWIAHVRDYIDVSQIRQDMLDLAVRWEREGFIGDTAAHTAIIEFGRMMHGGTS
jgi:Pyrimidine dimer DNA glycosylase